MHKYSSNLFSSNYDQSQLAESIMIDPFAAVSCASATHKRSKATNKLFRSRDIARLRESIQNKIGESYSAQVERSASVNWKNLSVQ